MQVTLTDIPVLWRQRNAVNGFIEDFQYPKTPQMLSAILGVNRSALMATKCKQSTLRWKQCLRRMMVDSTIKA